MRLLLPVDESDYSQAALRAVIAQVRRRSTEVRVLHVIEPTTAYVSAEYLPHLVHDTAEIERDRWRQARALVDRVVSALRRAEFKAAGVVDMGDPKRNILARAEKWNADLIVLGSHGLTGLNRFLMGSVSDAVSRHAGCSVQVVRVRPRRDPAASNAGATGAARKRAAAPARPRKRK
jgi:nucleotide-binding universal stress UspA family protein